MYEAKNTQRALVRIGFDGKVHKTFRGPNAEERFANEIRVLKYLESRKCPFVPRVLNSDPKTLEMVTTNCGTIVQHITPERAAEAFDDLKTYGVRHDDPYPRNITYRASDGQFCVIDFEFAEIIDEQPADEEASAIVEYTSTGSLRWSGCTDRGRFRSNNEDAFLALLLDKYGIRHLGKTGESELHESDFIFAVSDGMGGERSGEFASRIAMEKITLVLPRHFSISDERLAVASDDILGELFASIHAAMLELGRYDANCRNMGATLTLAWFRGRRVYFGHIGDSRLYHLPSSGRMHQLTHDHTHVGWLRRAGKLNEREARTHPRKNVLSQALGAGHRYLNPQLGVIEYEPGDLFVLCSDGVNEGLWDQSIAEICRATKVDQTDASIAETLVMTAGRESGRDNATGVVVETL